MAHNVVMPDRSFRPDLMGSGESLDAFLARLKAQLSRPKTKGRRPPPDDGRFITSRRPKGGAGGAEAPLPDERPPADCFAC